MSVSVQSSSLKKTSPSQLRSSHKKPQSNSGRTYKNIRSTDLSDSLREFERLKKNGTFPVGVIKLDESSLEKSCYSTNFIGRFFVATIPTLVILAVGAEAIILMIDSLKNKKECRVSLAAAIFRLCLCAAYAGFGIAIHRYEKLKEKDDEALDAYKDELYKKATFSIFLSNFNELKNLVEYTNEQIDQSTSVIQKAHKCLSKLNECDLQQMHFPPEIWVSLIIYLMNKNSKNKEFNELIQNALKPYMEISKKDSQAELNPPLRKKRSKKFHGESAGDASVNIETINSSVNIDRADTAALFTQIKQMGCRLNLRAIVVEDESEEEYCIGLDGLVYDDISLALESVPDDSYTIDFKTNPDN